MPLPLRNTIFCLLSLFGILSCKPQELLVSSLDVPSFSLQGFPKAVFTPINETVISISVPYGTNLKDLKLNFKLLGEGNVIPASRFDRIGKSLVDRYPDPNLPGTARNFDGRPSGPAFARSPFAGQQQFAGIDGPGHQPEADGQLPARQPGSGAAGLDSQ